VLVTKLHVPRSPARFVHRARLIARLYEGSAGKLTLVCAPAGFGKTALLTDWVEQRTGEAAWLSLDPGDNEPVRFWCHVLAALDRVRPGLAARVSPLLGSPAASYEGVVTSIVNELAATTDSDNSVAVSLVFDDYHVIESGPIHASLLFLLEHAPPGVHVTLASRADPPLPLARLRARGHLVELRAADLRFTTNEAAELLRRSAGAKLGDDDVAALTTRTEGWAAGLQLAGLSLQHRADIAGFVAMFSGSHRYVFDYLAEEVLESQPGPVREFLFETSVLDRLSGPLCDAVTGRTGSQQMLEAVEAANLFLVPLDDVRGWWRYHQLFADLLRSRLQQEQPERVQRLHAAAARWLAAHDLHEDAIRHWVAAGELDRAGHLIEDQFDTRFRTGEQATIERWLSMLPAEVVRSRPRLCLARAYAALFTNDLDRVDDTLAAAELAAPANDDASFHPSVGLEASLIANVSAAIALVGSMSARARGDLDATTSLAEAAMARVHPDERMQANASRQQLAITHWLGGRLDEAERTLASTIADWQADELVGVTWATNALGPMQRAQGRLSAAAETYQRLLALSAEPGRPGALAAEGLARVGLAEIAYDRGELDHAYRNVTDGIAIGRQLGYHRLLSTGLARLAWIHLANGDQGAARDTMEEANRTIPTHGPTELTPAPVLRARLLLALGDAEEVARWTAGRGLAPTDEPDHLREGEYLVLARLLLAQRQPDLALLLLDRFHDSATSQGRVGSLIEIQALRALALAACGDEADATVTLSGALALAHPEHHIRVFVDEGAPMATLIGLLVSDRTFEGVETGAVPLAYFGRLANEFDRAQGHTDVPGGTRLSVLVVPLTEREFDVLVLLADGKPNQAIADELFVALNTVKHHVTRILDKLGSTNRTEAVARARQLGLIP